jgi:hypothetical protein
MIERGPRHRERVDFASADWQRNEFGVDVLLLSEDPVSGAVTLALRTPAGLVYPEREHFYDCDEDLFQFEGEFHHDEERPFHTGDYVYRPPGTVYGHSQGSNGGIIIAALNNRPRRFHFDDHPPWTGEYLVDAAWQRRAVQPFVVRCGSLAWQDAGLGQGIELQALRGVPGQRSSLYGARTHSPWGADAACMLRIPRGFEGTAPAWPQAVLEVLVTAGQADLSGETWYRGCYGFDAFTGPCRVTEDLELYARVFLRPEQESAD